MTRLWMVVAVLIATVTGVAVAEGELTLDAHWSLEGGMGLGATGEDLLQGLALYWPDYENDGAAGLIMLGGDQAPENECGIGPAAEFPLGPVYDAALHTILPDYIADAFAEAMVPVRPVGLVAVAFDDNFKPTAVIGTGFHIWPSKHIQPTVRTEYMKPDSSSALAEMEGIWTFLNVAGFF